MYIICNDELRVIGISITPNIYHFFVLGTFKILFWNIMVGGELLQSTLLAYMELSQ
jgi:hypothetical protein